MTTTVIAYVKWFSFKHYFVIFFLFYSCLSGKQFNWKVSGEVGNFHSNNFSNSENDGLLLKFRTSLSYQKVKENFSWEVYTKFLPELYGVTLSTKIFKFNGGGHYQKQYKNWQWNAFLSKQNNFYHTTIQNFSANILNLGINILWFYKKQWFYSLNLQYYYRDIINSYAQNMDALLFQGNLIYSFSPNSSLNLGPYFEIFMVKSSDYLPLLHQATNDEIGHSNNNPVDTGISNGWRLGPQLSWSYQKQLIFNLSYRLLVHQSDLLHRFALEHRLRIVLGKILSSQFSMMFLTDYYFNQVKLTGENDYLLAYSPIENENKVYLKLEHTLKPGKSFYVKSGYLNNSYKFEDFSISGWLIVGGIEFSH